MKTWTTTLTDHQANTAHPSVYVVKSMTGNKSAADSVSLVTTGRSGLHQMSNRFSTPCHCFRLMLPLNSHSAPVPTFPLMSNTTFATDLLLPFVPKSTFPVFTHPFLPLSHQSNYIQQLKIRKQNTNQATYQKERTLYNPCTTKYILRDTNHAA